MFYVKGVNKAEEYNICEVFTRDKFFYENSIRRVAGWETPVSIIYRDGDKIKIRFKKELDRYAEDFVDDAFVSESDYSCWVSYDFALEQYNSEYPARRLEYAIKQYKESASSFNPVKLLPRELSEILAGDDLFPEVYPKQVDMSNNAFCNWLPVDVDSVIVDFANCKNISGDKVVFFTAMGEQRFGHIGYDGRFYMNGTSYFYGVFDISNGLKALPTPQWFIDKTSCGMFCRFFKSYVLVLDNECYDYGGNFLADETRHHQNVSTMNSVICQLCNNQMEPPLDTPYAAIVIPESFLTFCLDDVERVVVPHLASCKALNERAWERFKILAQLFKRVGLEKDFGKAFSNVVTLNRHTVYGGSRRNALGETLLKNLKKLHKEIGSVKMSVVLQDVISLKKHIARINGATVIDYVVSTQDFNTLNDGKVPAVLKKDEIWNSLAPGSLAVFSCEAGGKLCVVTTKTKSGTGLNRG